MGKRASNVVDVLLVSNGTRQKIMSHVDDMSLA